MLLLIEPPPGSMTASFLIGIAVGYAGFSLTSTAPTSLAVRQLQPTDSTTQVTRPTAVTPRPEGVQLCGLRNVRLEEVPLPDSTRAQYKLTALTPSGSKLVYVYGDSAQ